MASFQIHQDQENRGVRQHKKVIGNVLQESKRAVLGNIPIQGSNIHQLKAKERVKTFGPENACAKSKPVNAHQKAPVKIREDTVPKNVAELKPKPVLCDVTKLTSKNGIPPAFKDRLCARQEPLAASSKAEEPMSEGECESPMRIDKSIDNAIAKKYYDYLFDMEEYKHEIYMHLRGIEVLRRPKAGYMRKQPDITFSMRSILVDWLVEVTEEYKMEPETLYLAVSYIDRFLSFMSVVKANLQLVGTAAMFIAAKYEEIYPPELGEFVYLTDDTYTKTQVLKMENLILKVLSFDLSVPTALCFIKKYCVETQASDKVKSLAMYLSELSLLEGDPYLKFLPSELACSAFAIARHNFDLELWNEELESITGYTVEEFKTCMLCLNETFSKASSYPQKAVYEKFKSSKWHSVSLMTPSPVTSLNPTQ